MDHMNGQEQVFVDSYHFFDNTIHRPHIPI